MHNNAESRLINFWLMLIAVNILCHMYAILSNTSHPIEFSIFAIGTNVASAIFIVAIYLLRELRAIKNEITRNQSQKAQ